MKARHGGKDPAIAAELLAERRRTLFARLSPVPPHWRPGRPETWVLDRARCPFCGGDGSRTSIELGGETVELWECLECEVDWRAAKVDPISA